MVGTIPWNWEGCSSARRVRCGARFPVTTCSSACQGFDLISFFGSRGMPVMPVDRAGPVGTKFPMPRGLAAHDRSRRSQREHEIDRSVSQSGPEKRPPNASPVEKLRMKCLLSRGVLTKQTCLCGLLRSYPKSSLPLTVPIDDRAADRDDGGADDEGADRGPVWQAPATCPSGSG